MTLQSSREEEEFPIEGLDKSGKWSKSFQGETRAGQGDKERTGLPGIIVRGPCRASLVTQMVKSLPAVWETQVRSLGQEDPLKEMATHSSTLTWKIPWIEEPGRLHEVTKSRAQLSDFTHFQMRGEGSKEERKQEIWEPERDGETDRAITI